MIGFVKMWNKNKAYGFITGQDGVDYYVFYKAVITTGQRRLETGQEVEFDPAPPRIPGRQNQAINVNILD